MECDGLLKFIFKAKTSGKIPWEQPKVHMIDSDRSLLTDIGLNLDTRRQLIESFSICKIFEFYYLYIM